MEYLQQRLYGLQNLKHYCLAFDRKNLLPLGLEWSCHGSGPVQLCALRHISSLSFLICKIRITVVPMLLRIEMEDGLLIHGF